MSEVKVTEAAYIEVALERDRLKAEVERLREYADGETEKLRAALRELDERA